MPDRIVFSTRDISRMITLYSKGKTLREVAQVFGNDKVTIAKVLRENGVKLRRTNRDFIVLTKDQEREVIKQFHMGHRLRDVAKNSGLSTYLVSNVLKKHGLRFKRGKPYTKREKSKHHKNGIYIGQDGYHRIYLDSDDPFYCMANKTGYTLLHRIVMAKHLGRPLSKNESVHHINGDRSDNRIRNLQLRHRHHGYGSTLCCGDCGSKNIVYKKI